MGLQTRSSQALAPYSYLGSSKHEGGLPSTTRDWRAAECSKGSSGDSNRQQRFKHCCPGTKCLNHEGATASPEGLARIQIPGPCPRRFLSENLNTGPENLHSYKCPSDADPAIQHHALSGKAISTSGLEVWYWTSSISILWELVGNANSWDLSQTH